MQEARSYQRKLVRCVVNYGDPVGHDAVEGQDRLEDGQSKAPHFRWSDLLWGVCSGPQPPRSPQTALTLLVCT